jgi:peroxiredoxin Q/BCP
VPEDPLPSIGVGDRFPVEALPHPLVGPAVVYFYPQDMTSTCTVEAHGFNELYDDFRAAGVEVLGVSVDTEESHREFAEQCGLRFALIADAGKELTGKVGLLKDFGEHGILAARWTFLVDEDGTVQAVWHVTDSNVHPREVLEQVQHAA